MPTDGRAHGVQTGSSLGHLLATRGRLIGDHEGADPRFGVRPEPAAGLELANQLPVVDCMAPKSALAELMNPQECVDIGEEWVRCHIQIITG